MNIPAPKPSAAPIVESKPLVTDSVVTERLQSLASVDISAHAQIYEELLVALQNELNQTGRGGQ